MLICRNIYMKKNILFLISLLFIYLFIVSCGGSAEVLEKTTTETLTSLPVEAVYKLSGNIIKTINKVSTSDQYILNVNKKETITIDGDTAKVSFSFILLLKETTSIDSKISEDKSGVIVYPFYWDIPTGSWKQQNDPYIDLKKNDFVEIKGIINDYETNQPISGARIYPINNKFDTGFLVSNTNGYFRDFIFKDDNTTYDFLITAPGYEENRLTTSYDVSKKTSVDLGIIKLKPSGIGISGTSISGTVKQDSIPVSDAKVYLASTVSGNELSQYSKILTGSNGDFLFTGLSSGDYYLVVEKDSKKKITEFSITSENTGKNITIDIILSNEELLITTDNVQSQQATISWNLQAGLLVFDIYVNGELIEEDYNSNSIELTGLSDVIVNKVDVIAKDLSGNKITEASIFIITAASQSKWTMLVYMAADNNLSDLAYSDINEMEKIGSNDYLKMVVQIDDATNNGTKRYLINKDSDETTLSSPVIETISENDSSDSVAMKEFFEWGIENYPSNNIILVVWDHGTGWRNAPVRKAIAFDDTSSNSMTISELSNVMSDISTSIGKKIDILALDACLMQNMELLFEIYNSTDILIGSSETSPGNGFPYDRIAKFINDNNGESTPLEVAENFTQSFLDEYQGNDFGTISVLDTSTYLNIKQAFEDFCLSLIDSKEFDAYYTAWSESLKYDNDNSNVDLKDFLLNLNTNITNLDLSSKISDFSNALTDLIKYNVYTGMQGNPGGISLFVPDIKNNGWSNERLEYKSLEIAQNSSYDDFLDTFEAYYTGEAPSTRDWTILVYMAGDNDLSNQAVIDINEMEEADLGDNISVIVEADFADNDGSTRYEISNDSDFQTINSTVLSTSTEKDSSDPQTIIDFYKYGIDNYPASNYMLVLWDHGSGWRYAPARKAIAFDDTSSSNLSPSELQTVLTSIKSYIGKKVPIFMMDACVMQMIEVVYEIKDDVDYILAAEEGTPTNGAPYDEVLDYIIDNSGQSPETISSAIPQIFVDSYDNGSQGTSKAQFSNVDTSQLDSFMNNLDTFSDELEGVITSEKDDILWEQGSSLSLYQDDANIDIKDFAQRIYDSANITGINLKSSANTLINSFSDLVIANSYTGYGLVNPCGVSFYFPSMQGTDYSQNYTKYNNLSFASASRWDDFLSSFYDSFNSSQESDKWTIAVYMAADSNIELPALEDINQMEEADIPSDVNVVVQFDGNGDTGLKRYNIVKDQDTTTITSPIIVDAAEVDSGSSQSLSDFFSWTVDNYPADNYMLVVWDHGTGFREAPSRKAISFDDTSSSRMTIPELGTALDSIYTKLGRKLDILMLDASFMQCAELLFEVGDDVSYILGTAYSTPTKYAPYKEIINAMTADTTITPENYSKAIPPLYIASYSGGTQGSETCQYSAVDTSQLASFDTELTSFSDLLIQNFATYSMAYSWAYTSTIDYDVEFMDISSYATNIKSQVNNSSIDNQADSLISAVDSLVVQNNHTGFGFYVPSGIYIYIPDNNGGTWNSTKTYYDGLAISTETTWNNFIDNL